MFVREIDAKSRDLIWERGSVSKHRQNSIIVEFGEVPGGVVTVLEGRITLYRREEKQMKTVGTFHKGQTIGESWLLYEMESEVRAFASSNCTIHTANRKNIGPSNGDLARSVAAQLARHLIERVKPGALSTIPV